MRMNRRVCTLERQLGVNTTPTAQQLDIRAKVEAIRRKRCERTGVPFEPIRWDDRNIETMSIAETILALRFKRLAQARSQNNS